MVHACHSAPGINFLIPSAILIASVLGSLHCVGMCGGLVIAATRSTWDHVAYHIGRLLGYMTATLLVFFLGKSLLSQLNETIAPIVVKVVLGTYFVLLGLMVLRSKKLQLHTRLPFIERLYQQLLKGRPSRLRSGLIGFVSVGLPCGWLYLFVFGAASLGTLQGALVAITLFWLGTLPALGLAPLIFKRLLSRFQKRAPVVIGLAFIVIGLLTLFSR